MESGSFSSIFWKNLWRTFFFLLKYSIKFTNEDLWSSVFLCGKLFDYEFNLLITWRLSICYWVSWIAYIVLRICQLYLSYPNMLTYKLISIMSLFYFWFNNLSHLFFSVSAGKYLSILLIFLKNHTFILLYFPLFFYFLFHWFLL